MTKKFLLVVGSGIHRQARVETAKGPLACWDKLLKALAEKIQRAEDLHTVGLPPSIAWERMILAEVIASKKTGHGLQASKVEECLRKNVRDLICSHSQEARRFSVNELVSSLLSHEHVAEMISLNFETSWHPDATEDIESFPAPFFEEHLKHSSKQQLTLRSTTTQGMRIWFPNGHHKLPPTLRMGLRDFGLQPEAIRTAYAAYKQWQKQVLGNERKGPKDPPLDADSLRKLRDIWQTSGGRLEIGRANTWVTAFMLYTPVFVGASIGKDELGMWWLLCQRERDLARVQSAEKPIFLNILQPGSSEVAEKWNAPRIFGENVSSDNPDEAWRKLLLRIERA